MKPEPPVFRYILFVQRSSMDSILLVWLAAAAFAALAAPRPASADELFALQQLLSTGRTATAEFADFDGDRRTDLLQIAYVGHAPHETRELRVLESIAASPSAWLGSLGLERVAKLRKS